MFDAIGMVYVEEGVLKDQKTLEKLGKLAPKLRQDMDELFRRM